MRNRFKKLAYLFLAFLLILNIGCSLTKPNKKVEKPVIENANNETVNIEEAITEEKDESDDQINIKKGQYYYDVEEVAAYIHLFGELPPNYITKEEAKKIGWSVGDGSEYVIGGNKFGNREGLLPKEKDRIYFEADISAGYKKNRGPLRLVFSNDGLVFYTEDHYGSFVQLY